MNSNGFVSVLLLVTVLAVCATSSSSLSVSEVTHVLDSILRGYDKRVRPHHGAKPVEVVVTMYALKLFDFDNTNNDFKIDFYFRQQWNDPRLAFPDKGRVKIAASQEVINKMWIPDTFFPSDKDGYRASITVPNAFVNINSNGTIFLSQRFTTHTECVGGLAFFPFDRHVCKLDIESYGYSSSDIVYSWRTYGNTVGVGVDLSSFDLVSLSDYQTDIQLATGNYSRVGVRFVIDRQTSGYFVRFFAPAAMATLASFLPFFLSKSSAMPRVLLGTFTLFSTLIFVAIVSALFTPNTGTTTAMDIFLLASLGFVFISLFLVVYTVYLIEESAPSEGHDENKPTVLNGNHGRLVTVDRLGRYLLPLGYAVFNGVYLVSALSLSVALS